MSDGVYRPPPHVESPRIAQYPKSDPRARWIPTAPAAPAPQPITLVGMVGVRGAA